MLPTADFFGTQVTRLIVGDNPFSGHSYIEEVVTGGEMMDYYTAENIVKALFDAERAGYNTYLPLADPFILRVIRQYRNEGGNMHLIFQPYPPIGLDINIRQMLGCGPLAIYHQGTTTDNLMEAGKVDVLRDNIKMLKDTGIPAGLGTHVPETIMRAEDEDWGIDFYLASLYNARKNNREESSFITGKPKSLVFYPNDRFLMYETVRQVQKPFLVYKIFAGGQVFHGKSEKEIPGVAEAVIKETFENIKPGDFAIVGVYQKYKDMLAENAGFAKKVL